MIAIYTGRPATGKTYILTRLALKFLKKGLQVYCNYWIDWQGDNLHHWDSVDDIIEVQDGIIIMDEAQVYFNSRDWLNLPPKWQYKLQQHRKEGLHIYGSVQNFKRLDTIMRELVSRYYECKRIAGLIAVREYEPDDNDKKKRDLLGMRFYLLRKKFYKRYNTLEKINTKHLEKKFEFSELRKQF